MIDLFLPLMIAFITTVLATPLAIKLAFKFYLVDDPAKRPHPAHLHTRIIPRAGGIPIYIGICISILAFIPPDQHIFGILGALTLLLVMGITDDYLRNFSPYPRLLLQFIAALIAVASGIGISFVTNPFGGILRLDQIVYPVNFFGMHNIVLLADIFALIWITWMMNMVNWSKGVDGQMPGIIAVAGVTMGLLSYKLFLDGDPNQLAIAQLSFITSGAALGFIVFNWHPAKMLPGFSASTILGFMIAILSILSGAKLATALLVLLIPLIDALYAVTRRILSGKSPVRADRRHLHHLLLDKGWSHQRISLFYIISCAILGAVAINLNSEGKLFTLVGVGAVVLGFILWLSFFGESFGKSDRDNG